MVERKNRRYHDRVAGRYDAMYDRPYWRFYRDLSWRHLARFLPEKRPAWAADLGCGTGYFGRKLLKAGFDVIFLDPSGAMLEKARAKVEAEGSRGRQLRFVQAGLEDMSEIEDELIHFATGQGDPLSFCKDPKQGLRECRRILKPGGGLVLSVDSRVAGVRSLSERKRPDEMLELLRSGRSKWQAQRSDESFGMKMFDPEELEKLLVKAGFEPLSRIAKTCLVQRQNEGWLEDPKQRRRLLEAEEKVHGLPHWFGLASHFQVGARRS